MWKEWHNLRVKTTDKRKRTIRFHRNDVYEDSGEEKWAE
jgi:hypothetical protein